MPGANGEGYGASAAAPREMAGKPRAPPAIRTPPIGLEPFADAGIPIPCCAARRYGGVADDEPPIALPPGELARAVEGPEGLSKARLRYPIPPCGAHMDPAPGMARSYPSGAAAAAAKRGGKQGETRA